VTEVFDYTGSEYHELRYPELLADKELRQAWSNFSDLAYFGNVVTGDVVMEFGAGLGANLLSVSKRAETWMIEPAAIGRRLAEQNGIHTASSIDELPHGIAFDFILCRHVLEHVCDPRSTLQALRKVLRVDGRLMLVLPCEPPNAMPDARDIDHHLFCWNPRTISNLLQVCGFKVVGLRNEYFNGRRRLLPFYRIAGGLAYARAIRFMGRMLRCKELVIESKPV
jgi:SAM-dependent methyltransferase